jgi:hypothetical protein
MSDDQFTKLFKYMQREFKLVRRDIADVKDSINIYASAVDAFAKRTEIYHQEMLVLNHQVERHDGWIHHVANTTDTKLGF